MFGVFVPMTDARGQYGFSGYLALSLGLLLALRLDPGA
jgi:hypothetical protein